jgi:hypothetical protein
LLGEHIEVPQRVLAETSGDRRPASGDGRGNDEKRSPLLPERERRPEGPRG